MSGANGRQSLFTWALAARPKTLWAAVAPVMVGTSMAFEAGAMHLPSAGAALLGAMLIQIGTNFSNDYLDFLKGADADNRKGPLRVTQAGLISAETMRRATFTAFALAFAVGMYLVHRGGWPVLVLGIVCIIAGVLYTAGRYSLAYLGLGDLAVLIFFGPVAVGGTYYVQTLDLSMLVLIGGMGPGLLAAAILIVNNVRDVAEDRVANKRTLIVRFGRDTGILLYSMCLIFSALLSLVVIALTGEKWWLLLTFIILPLGLRYARQMKRQKDSDSLNQLLGSTSQLLLLYALLFSTGWII